MPEFAKISQGQNEFTDRDPIVLNLHYGQIDRWVFSGMKGTDVKVLKSDNSDDIQIGEEVMISETIFMKWIKLTTLIDRSASRKENYHVKRSIKNIAFRLGYTNRMSLYKVLKPLYEVGLIDLKESKKDDTKMIDIIVFPYPVYAKSNICLLVKCRDWSKRKSFGFGLSALGLKAKQDKKIISDKEQLEDVVNKSLQESVNKSIQPLVNKSLQESVNKSIQPLVNKSLHSNINNLTNDSNISNDSNHLINKLHETVAKSLEIFLNQEKINDDERLMMIDQLIGFQFQSSKYESHQKYFHKTLNSIRSQKPKKTVVKKDKLPKWAAEPQDSSTQMSEEEYLKTQEKLNRMLQEFKEKNKSSS